MKRIILLLLSALVFTGAFSQEKPVPVDFRWGVGSSLLGTGDMVTMMFQNEINYRLNPYLAAGFELDYGRSNLGVHEMVSFVGSQLNLFASPFKNTRRLDFRVGVGLSHYRVADARETRSEYENGVLIDIDYEFVKRKSFGGSIMIENTLLVTDHLMLGFRLFTTPYKNGDINSGLLLKLGYRL